MPRSSFVKIRSDLQAIYGNAATAFDLDCSNPGMRSVLKEIEAQTEELKDEWTQMMKDKYGAKVTEDSVQVWRALKSLTGGEARKVVMSVKNEDGFKAWQKLHMHFGPSLSAKQGMALADFSGMVAKPATKPGETKSSQSSSGE